jgi:probable F420-dependent oxidoreductase
MTTGSLDVGIRPPSWIDLDIDFHGVTDWVVQAEERGFDSVHAGDRLLAKVPPYYESTMWEVTTTLSTWAAETETIELGPLIFVVPYRNPIQIAKVFGTLDIASDGRLVMGVGNGWNPIEFEALGIPKAERGRRLEEGIDTLQRLWTQDHVDHEGEIYEFEDVTVEPKPVQDPYPPIWFGSFGPQVDDFDKVVRRVLERIGRYGDGWVPLTYSTDAKKMLDPEKLGNAWDILADGARDAGRDPDDIEFVYSHWSYVMDDESEEREACESALNRWLDGTYEEGKDTYLIGTPEEIVDDIERAVAEVPRVDRFIFTPFTFDDEQQRRIADDVVPLLRDRF